MSELLELVLAAKTATEAEQMAHIWAAAEPKIKLDRVTRVRPSGDAWGEKWIVEIAYSAVSEDQQTLKL